MNEIDTFIYLFLVYINIIDYEGIKVRTYMKTEFAEYKVHRSVFIKKYNCRFDDP